MTSDSPARAVPARMLSFGTAGLRGIMAEGLGYMNRDAVRWATQGVAEIILEEAAADRGVVVAHDCRLNSAEFARAAACVFAANGIRVRLFESLRPTPELSFAVRSYGAAGGVNITASHNPAEYNGYKAYWSDGAQLGAELTERVASRMQKSQGRTRDMSFDAAIEAGLIELIGAQTDEAFLSACIAAAPVSPALADEDFCVVYSPLHGAGAKLVPAALTRAGLKRLVCTAEQMEPDGSFPTLEKPNPEEDAAFELSLKHAKECSARLIIASDPDADRIGVMTLHRGRYRRLGGNELGALMTEYVLRHMSAEGRLPEKAAVLKSFVSTPLADKIAASYGVAAENTVTGFRFIAERMAKLERSGVKTVFAFEESCGYLCGDHVRDKDAVTAALIAASMAAEYARRGMSLVDALEELYLRFGYHKERTLSLALENEAAAAAARRRIRELSEAPPRFVGGEAVARVRDFHRGLNAEGVHGRDDMLCLELEGGGAYILRPSGTEPKLKLYLMAQGATKADCERRLAALMRAELI